MKAPKIAIMLDENTSSGGGHYDISKNYFSAIAQGGGIPYGIPYLNKIVSGIVLEFDGFFSVGGAVAFSPDWYAPGHRTPYPASERTAVEIALMKGFLEAKKPVLGACNGMQILAALHGCKLRSDVDETKHKNTKHIVDVMPGTLLAQIVGASSLTVNSRHREAVATVGPEVRTSARAEDDIIEAIEIPGHSFALGYQWHQEDFWKNDHPGNLIFSAFVKSAAG